MSFQLYTNDWASLVGDAFSSATDTNVGSSTMGDAAGEFCFDSGCTEEITTPLTPSFVGGATRSADQNLPSTWGHSGTASSLSADETHNYLYDSSATDGLLSADDNSVDVGFFDEVMQQQQQQLLHAVGADMSQNGASIYGTAGSFEPHELEIPTPPHHESCNDNDSEEDHCSGTASSSVDGDESIPECDPEQSVQHHVEVSNTTIYSTQYSTGSLNSEDATPASIESTSISTTFAHKTKAEQHNTSTESTLKVSGTSSYTIIHSPIQSKKRTWQVAFPSVHQSQEFSSSSGRIQSRVGSRFQAAIPPLRKRRRLHGPSPTLSTAATEEPASTQATAVSQQQNESTSTSTHHHHDNQHVSTLDDNEENHHKLLQPVFTPNVLPKEALNEFLHQVREHLASHLQQNQIPEGRAAKLPHDTYQILAQCNYDTNEALKFFKCKYSEQYVDPAALDRRERHLFGCMAQKFRNRNTGARRSPNLQRMFRTKLFRPERTVGHLVNHYFQHEYISDNEEESEDESAGEFSMRSPVTTFASKSPKFDQQQQQQDDEDEEDQALSLQFSRRPL